MCGIVVRSSRGVPWCLSDWGGAIMSVGRLGKIAWRRYNFQSFFAMISIKGAVNIGDIVGLVAGSPPKAP